MFLDEHFGFLVIFVMFLDEHFGFLAIFVIFLDALFGFLVIFVIFLDEHFGFLVIFVIFLDEHFGFLVIFVMFLGWTPWFSPVFCGFGASGTHLWGLTRPVYGSFLERTWFWIWSPKFSKGFLGKKNRCFTHGHLYISQYLPHKLPKTNCSSICTSTAQEAKNPIWPWVKPPTVR